MSYSYHQYQEQWQDKFGDDESGGFEYWQYGRLKIKVLPKMGVATFEATLKKFDSLSPQIDVLQNRSDYGANPALDNQVDNLLVESFRCELPLFF